MIAATMQDTARPLPGFSYSRAFFEDLVDAAVAHARALGASDAGAEASEGVGSDTSTPVFPNTLYFMIIDSYIGLIIFPGFNQRIAHSEQFACRGVHL